VVTLWQRCGLTMPYNDPDQDIDFARGKTGSDVLVGLIEGEVIASVMVGHDGHRGWIYYVAVHPDRQGVGHGAAIVRAAEQWLAEKGVPKAMLMVRKTNKKAAGFYEALGYEEASSIVLQRWLITPKA
jgi:ribosomal protein S18 acetylase RimI-like enzyme